MGLRESDVTLAALGLSLAGLAVADARRTTEKGSRAMKTPADLGPDVTVSLENPYDSPDVDIGLIRPGQESLGIMRIFGRAPAGLWTVLEVEADRGYGPLLYDIALECVHLSGGQGLMPDRAYVSQQAGRVWERYLTREDVRHGPIPGSHRDAKRYHQDLEVDGDPEERPWLDNLFLKDEAPVISKLIQLKKLDFSALNRSPLKSSLIALKKKVSPAKLGSRATSPAAQEVMHVIAQAFKDDPAYSGISDRNPWRPVSYPGASFEDLNDVRLTFELTALRLGSDTQETYEDVLDKLKRLGFTQPARVWRFVQSGKARVAIHVKDERLRLVVEDFQMRHLLGGTGDATPWSQAKSRGLLPMWRKGGPDAR